MARNLSRQHMLFQPKQKTGGGSYLWLAVIALALSAIWLGLQMSRGQIKPMFEPTPTATRAALSYLEEAQAYFSAGKLDDPNSDQDAIDTYRLATQVNPGDAQVWAELARIQTYSSALLSTDAERLTRLQEALESARKAAELAPEDATVQAILALALDWNASSNLITAEQREDYLNEAEQMAVRAFNLDPQNALALAFYAEVLLDQQRIEQALQYAKKAVDTNPDSMDVHRVYGNVLESMGAYRDAVTEYRLASEINPNLTFLYLRWGLVYRDALSGGNPKSTYLDDALTLFDRAAQINNQLGIRDPYPYLAIAKTYVQKGEFFVAALNAEKALAFDPANANTYGQLGMIYVQAKNYESALPALQCAVDGCETWWRLPSEDPTVQDKFPCREDDCTPLMCEEEGCSEKEKTVALSWYGPDYRVEKVTVTPLELSNMNVAYYYIRYGSVLAYLSRAGDGSCQKALGLMQQLRAKYPQDTILMDNVSDNEALCYRLLGTPAP